MKFILNNNLGQPRAQISLFVLQGPSFALQMFHRGAETDVIHGEEWLGLIEPALKAAKEQGARDLMIRVSSVLNSPVLESGLECLGFGRTNARVEFRALLVDLPSDAGSPLKWQSLAELGWDDTRAAAFLREVGNGDPDFGPDEDALEALQGYRADEGLTNGPECFQIGFRDGEPVAMVVAQIDPKPTPKWSRITYMGIVPHARGQGLGKWVHRHGFAMMRAQGGELYHGGTLLQNEGMQRLFRAHGCTEYRRMQEWKILLARS